MTNSQIISYLEDIVAPTQTLNLTWWQIKLRDLADKLKEEEAMTKISEGRRPAAKPWPLFGYAPGSYMCLCIICEKQFEGDKRAYNCLPCAASLANDILSRRAAEQQCPVAFIREAALNLIASNGFFETELSREPSEKMVRTVPLFTPPPPSGEAGEPEVKPLEWEYWEANSVNYERWYARTILGEYRIYRTPDGYQYYASSGGDMHVQNTLEEAQSEVQRMFDYKLRSALLPTIKEPTDE